MGSTLRRWRCIRAREACVQVHRPLERRHPRRTFPDQPDPAIVQDPNRSTNFTYGNDADGTRCPIGAHIRRVNPRDAFGFQGRLINRRRITRRGLPYGTFAPEDDAATSHDPSELDSTERGVVFMALNANISRQFEFVQQQWIAYGNDAHLGNEKDLLMGSHSEGEKVRHPGRHKPPAIHLLSARACPTSSSFAEESTFSSPASPPSG